jgi:Resolvase, N terminal domain
MRDLQKFVAKVHHFARICATLDESNMKIGYARVSTLEQNLDLQLQALKKAGCRRIFQEKISAGTRNRPEFQRMLDQIRVGDTIAVWKLDRLARSTRDLLETMETIQQIGAKFQSLSEPWADTTTHAGKMIMTIFAGIAEYVESAVMRSDAIEVEVWPALWPLGAPHNIQGHGRQPMRDYGEVRQQGLAVWPEPGRNLFGQALTFPG